MAGLRTLYPHIQKYPVERGQMNYTQHTVVVGQAGDTLADPDFICDGVDDHVQIQEAIDFIYGLGGGSILIREGIYNITARIIPKDNVHITGAGREATRLSGALPFNWIIRNNITGDFDTITNFSLSNMSITPLGATSASAVGFNNPSQVRVSNVYFFNGGDNGWLLRFGAEPSDTTTFIGKQNIVEDCKFDVHFGNLEMLLAHNVQDTHINRCEFTNKTSGPVLGFWQKSFDCSVSDCIWEDCTGGNCFYFSYSSKRIRGQNLTFINTGDAIEGANVSDNGRFGDDFCDSLSLINVSCIGGANSINANALDVGAIRDSYIENLYVEKYNRAVRLDSGNDIPAFPHAQTIRRVTLVNPVLRNNTASNANFTLNAAIFITSGTSTDATQPLKLRVIGGEIYDDQASPTQRAPLTIQSSVVTTFQDIEFHGTRITPYLGADPVIIDGSASIDNTVRFYKCPGVTTKSSGTATILDSTSTVTVTHGIQDTLPAPTAQNISVTPASDLGSNAFFVENITTTTFDITLGGGATATGDLDFIWSVDLYSSDT